MVTAKLNSETSCVVKAFVDATPISAPALVYKTSFDARAIALSCTLQIAKLKFWPKDWACFKASMVSKVSPDWEMVRINWFGLDTESR